MELSKTLRLRRIGRVLLLVLWAIIFLFAVDSQAQDPAGSQYVRQANKDSVVVFVHGVLGDSLSTWTNGSTKAYWPDLMKADPYFNEFDIFVIGYSSSFLHPGYKIDELVEVMRRDLESADIFTKHKHVYFLCHSMGGLVVRGYLTRYQKRASQVPMVYFFSTPTTGAQIANLGTLLSRNRQMEGMLPIDANEYLASVQKGWLAAQFSIASYCAYETQDTDGIRVVNESSATNLCNRPLDPIDANHFDIVKPSDIKDAPYISFRNALRAERPEPTTKRSPSKEKLFAADILYALPNRDSLNRPILWVVSKPSKLVVPVDVFLKIRVVNLQKNKASLDSISIEIKGTTDWIKFKAIPMQGMTVVVGNLATARECTVFPADIGEVFQSEIEPGGKAEATGFFGSSVMPFMIPEPPKFRITLRDTVGRLTVIETSGVPPSDEPGLDQTVFKTFGQLEDFSSFRQQRF